MIQSQVPDRDLVVAHFVRTRRRTARLTQQELADLAGVGKRFVVELEGGKPALRLDKINQVLRAFGKRLGPIDLPRTDEALFTTSTTQRLEDRRAL
jgi:y4mF family transcriptional regulator